MENVLGIYEAMFTELNGKEAVYFEILKCEKIGDHVIPVKGGLISKHTILISDEDDTALTRDEIRFFLVENKISCHNIDRKFPIK